MDSTRHDRMVALFEAACAVPASERSAFLAAETDDEALRVEVLELLEHDDSVGFLTTDHEPGSRFVAAQEEISLPSEIGGFALREEIGRGGMGVVYRASQDHPRREVALKILLQGGLTPDARKRFELEAEALGRLQHPGIAQIHAAGTHRGDGLELPFLAMELVDGLSLTDWCVRHRPPRAARIELLIAVCDAVQHAHQRGLIHRDLKPANVLVDANGRPKVLDFGIARLLEDEPAATLHTRTGQVLGTLAYMSPEQAVGTVGSIDQRTDVHALGVLGFELLTGELPYAVAGETVTRALHVLASAEPKTLSAADRSLRGDLDTIFQKALERDPSRRYASAAELGADLRRFLDHEAIAARPPSAVYQLGKFARRHRGLVAGAAVAVVALVAGTVVSVLWALRAEDSAERARVAAERERIAAERERIAADEARVAREAALQNLRIAEAETERSTFLSDFTQELFLSAAPHVAQGREMSARDIVEEGKSQALSLPYEEQLTRSQICRFLGMVLVNMGDFEAAEPLVMQALDDLRRGTEGDDDRLVEALFTAGAMGFRSSRPDFAREQFEASLAMHRRLDGPEDHRVARCLEALGVLDVDSDQLEQGLQKIEESLGIWRRLTESDPKHWDDVARVLSNQGACLLSAGRLEEADAVLVEAIETAERAGRDDLWGSQATNLGSLRIRQRRVEEAEELFRGALEKGELYFGPDNIMLLPRLVNVASVCGMSGRLGEAEKLLERAVALCEGQDISRNENAAKALMSYGTLHAQRNQVKEALALWRRAAEIQEAIGGPLARPLAPTLENIAYAERMLGNEEEAARLFERVRAIRAR